MFRSKHSPVWPLRLIAAFSLIAPALLFSYATWQNYRAIDAQANERIERALDVLQEHALKALQTVERSISEVNEVLRGLSDEHIRANESDLFLRLKRTQQALPQIESIWAFNRDGHPLVSSTVLPVPRSLDNSDRSYFRAQAESDAGTYIGEVVRARVGSLRFFVISGRRQGEPIGSFNGVIGVTVMPEHFSEFYRKLTRGRDSFSLVKANGLVLARFPALRSDQFEQRGELSDAIPGSSDAGLFTAVSQLDMIERRYGYRRVPGFPVYVRTGVETGALSREFWTLAASQFATGIPAVLAIFVLALYALHRAQRFQEETARREAAEMALKQSQRLEAIGQLTGGIAHDFNNLLMVIGGNVDRLKRRAAADDPQRRALDAIDTAVKRGTNLTRQLLSFSRRQTHEAITIDLRQRLPAMGNMLRSSLRGDIKIEVSISEAVWPIKVDPSELELSLLNLAVNARDAMISGGRLTLSAYNVTFTGPNSFDLKGEFVAITVQDTGAGIAPEDLARVFEPFFTTKEVGKGTGLGLSQVYGFAQQAGGAATVVSELNRGTTVSLYLPRSRQAVEAEAETEGRPATVQAQMRGRGHILLVEDNLEVADVTRGLLEELGYVVFHAPDSPSAMTTLLEQGKKINILLTDIVMPGGANGLELARLVRAERGETLPVILATGYSDHAQTAADEGFAILRKPYDLGALRAAIANSLRESRRRGAA